MVTYFEPLLAALEEEEQCYQKKNQALVNEEKSLNKNARKCSDRATDTMGPSGCPPMFKTVRDNAATA